MGLLSKHTTSAQRDRAVARLQRVARWLDYAFVLPALKKRVGWDGVIGVVPIIGDVLMAVVALYIVLEAWRLGAPARTLARMLGNIAFDLLLGGLPVVGDIADFFFHASRRNLLLLGIAPGPDAPETPAPQTPARA
jgi:hypothetical protein